jgi:hypothetical protein
MSTTRLRIINAFYHLDNYLFGECKDNILTIRENDNEIQRRKLLSLMFR